MAPPGPDEISIRPVHRADEAAILTLAQQSHGWADDSTHADYFRWKHRDNPLGPSPMWVAMDGDRLAGFRTFVRWEFETPAGGVVRAVRAVDTATSPVYQGRGVFTRLTLHALEELRAERVDFVFNTPNAQSLPGYLKMGWQIVGRVPVAVRPRSLWSLGRMARARVPAERWSVATDVGLPASEALSDPGLDILLSSQPPATGLRTRRTVEFLRWRYAFPKLNYRCVLAGAGVEDGLVVFRLRRRGSAVETVLCEVVVRGADVGRQSLAVKQMARAVEADYVIKVAERPISLVGFVRLPRQGPVLTSRPVCTPEVPGMAGWALTMGDLELF